MPRPMHSPSVQVLCPGWIIIGHLTPALNSVEKRLICGDTSRDDKHLHNAWGKIPINQAQYNFRNFLQDRGYLHPVFTRQGLTHGPVQVDLGEQTRVSQILVLGGEELKELIDISRKRQVVGEPLTPALLNGLEKWVYDQLRTHGFACPEVKSEADPDTGVIRLMTEPGLQKTISSVIQEEIPETAPDLLRRYDAFPIGSMFNGDLLTLTENRVGLAGLVESNHFTTQCDTDTVSLRQAVLPGAPHLLRAGFGLNTEGLLLARVSWRNTRLGKYGSLFDITGSGSSKLQSATTQLNWYFLPEVSRLYLNPLLQISHRNEAHYEDLTARAQFGIATSEDYSALGVSYFLGPTYDTFEVLRGVGAPSSHLLSLEGRISLKSHDFELYSSNPQQGFQLSFTSDFNTKTFFSDITAQRLSLKLGALWNLKHYDPPLWIFGVRGGFSTLVSGETIGPGAPSITIPASLLQYLGGSIDLRGFGRQELPAYSSVGGLTSGFLGVELRLSHTLPLNLDPFVFSDVGAIGSSSLSFDLPVYWSPGMGMRWASPIGPLRMTLARGFANTVSQHWQFFLSLGEEF